MKLNNFRFEFQQTISLFFRPVFEVCFFLMGSHTSNYSPIDFHVLSPTRLTPQPSKHEKLNQC